MKLLLDENLSDQIVAQILDLYPGSSHVKAHDSIKTDDAILWSLARQHGFAIVSKDADFHQRSLVYGAPPKFIYLRAGNCSTSLVISLPRAEFALISAFDADTNATILVLP